MSTRTQNCRPTTPSWLTKLSPLACRLTPTSTPLLRSIQFAKARVRRASGLLLTTFSNARPNVLLRPHSALRGRPSEKALA